MTSRNGRPGTIRFFLRLISSPSLNLKQKGFTLTELLIAIVVSSIIIATLLYLVVELLMINRREDVLTQTQQDMRRAIDYITRDVSEAIYVYATPKLVEDELDLPAGNPILAFWRLESVDTSGLGDCSAFTNTELEECTALRVRQNTYNLVVYIQQENDGNSLWRGPSRILRYELPKYQNVATLAKTPTYDDPSQRTNSFETWTAGTGPRTGYSPPVLVDYVDAINTVDLDASKCPVGYGAATETSDSFYACLPADAGVADRNQSLRVYLRGNASDALSMVTFNDAGKLPALESEVLVRGVISKIPD
jgi:prepilin-type N-terminal cleavage/methylation domain-containing protein